MPFRQVGGYQGFERLRDSEDPAAQNYARRALAANGIHVPHGADAAAMWRDFSRNRMLQTNAAQVQAPGDLMGNPMDDVANGVHGLAMATAAPQQSVQASMVGPSGRRSYPGLQQGPATARMPVQGLAQGPGSPRVPTDWRARISDMASALAPGETLSHLKDFQFAAQNVGPAEDKFRRLSQVTNAHGAAARLALMLQSRKPSRARVFGME